MSRNVADSRFRSRFCLFALFIGSFIKTVSAEQIVIGEAGFEGAGGRGGGINVPPWRRSSTGLNAIMIESYSALGTKSDTVPGGGFYCHYNNGPSESIYQVLATNLVANATYRMSVVAIDRTDQVFKPSELRLGYLPGTDDGSTGSDAIANHFFGDYLLAATVLTNTIPVNGAAADDGYITWVSEFKVSADHPGAGKPIRIEIVGNGPQSLFDNVALEMIPGPPAGTLITIR